MKITVATNAGFCFGVRRATDRLEEALAQALLDCRRPGDTILVKASHFMGFSEIVKKLEQPQ